MLKKGQTKLQRPHSNMRMVFLSIEQGNHRRQDIMRDTGLPEGKVKSAQWNLAFIGCIVKTTDENGRTVYVVPREPREVAANLKGINSIFNAFTKS